MLSIYDELSNLAHGAGSIVRVVGLVAILVLIVGGFSS